MTFVINKKTARGIEPGATFLVIYYCSHNKLHMYSITRNVFFIPSYAIGAKEMEKTDKLFNIFKKSGVFDLIDDVYSK